MVQKLISSTVKKLLSLILRKMTLHATKMNLCSLKKQKHQLRKSQTLKKTRIAVQKKERMRAFRCNLVAIGEIPS